MARIREFLRVALALPSFWLWHVGPARAADAEGSIAAEAVFAEGKALMQNGDFVRACPKFAESFRLDPATGALYALALCHERVGKLATAWMEFKDVAARSNAEHADDREQTARKRAEALEPDLSFVVVRVDPAAQRLAGFRVLEDGVELRPVAWDTAIPVDPGRHTLLASAPGHASWKTNIDVVTARQRTVIVVPALAAEAGTYGAAHRVQPAATRLRLAGLVLGGAGVTGMAVAGYATWRALESKAAAASCHSQDCRGRSDHDRIVAHEAANFATLGFVFGSVCLGGALTLFWLDKPSPSTTGGARSFVRVSLDTISFVHEL